MDHKISLDHLVDMVDGESEGEKFNRDYSDSEGSEWGDDYDIDLYCRIGIHCHNFQKGTNLKFKRWEKHTAKYSGSMYFDITFKAKDSVTGSVLSFQSLLCDSGCASAWGVRLMLFNLASRIEPIGQERLDDEWDDDTLHDFYKGPMPKWFSDEALERDSKKYYVVPETELHDNDWFQLLMELAFFSRADRCVDNYRVLELKKVVVETLEEYITEACEKLKADNAIFYISYKCCPDHSSCTGNHEWKTRLDGDHVAIVRKTMDGKPGHMGLEVALTNEQEKDT